MSRHGRVNAMTVFSLVRPPLSWPPGGEYWLRTLFRFGRRFPPDTVRDLRFIHFARLAMIPRIPNRGQGVEDIGDPLLLFESNYDGGFAPYIDVFASAIPVKMRAFWATSRGFPGVSPVTPFKRYIRANEFTVDHYYAAYPDASAAMVAAALRLRERHAQFFQCARHLDAEDFRERYIAFLTEVQDDL